MNVSFTDKIGNLRNSLYFSKSYNEIFAKYDNSHFVIMKLNKNNKESYLPLLLHEINDYYEGYSSYGYGGIVGNIDHLSKDDFRKIIEFCKSNKIIDIFIRNAPFLNNHKIIPDEFNFFNRVTYIKELKLYKSFDEFTRVLNQKLRWSINAALKNNLEVNIKKYSEITDKDLDNFYSLYNKVMNIRKASEYYYFPKEFFQNTFNSLKEKIELFYIAVDGRFIAASMFMLDDDYVHYHFSASDRDFSKLQPMELLLSKAIYVYGAKGYKYLHLGGGLSPDASDGLSRFKKKFADFESEFYISKIICDKDIYDYLRNYYNVKNNLFLIKDAKL
ncbi:MAG TPA: GNAT family N-acetyltransferase [Defluviitaleaceae bacterium]|nr:GNAT family N-acetyltransferase [Defluviitaleaceae bacterium]